jgi:uncharacterized protein YyaL (SSP411 family)
MVEKTLQTMRRGGIFDHLGFGFHRYSTDRRWLVPHFEKMLYDQTLLADWNGLMIAALARAAQAFARPDYAEAAAATALYIRDKMTIKGRLHHRSAEGEVTIPAFLDDHAFLIWGLVELYQATFEAGHLSWASTLSEDLIRGFWDENNGGFFFTSPDLHKDLPSRRKELYDGALPSGNSVMTSNLLRLGRLLGRPEFEARAGRLIDAFSGKITQYPAAYTQFLCRLDFALGPSREVVIVGRTGAPDTLAMFDVLSKKFLPHAVVLFRPAEEREPEIAKLAPFTAAMSSLGDRATAYVCSNYRCERPTTEPDELRSLLI